MRDSPEFLDDIRASPTDDTPRLVYADWLEDHGNPTRADLIRVQCALRKTPWHAPERQRLANREVRLLRKHKDDWLGDFKSLVRSARFERGFVERVSLGARQFAEHAEEIVSRAPIQSVSLLQVSDRTAPAVASTQALGLIRELLIHGGRMTDVGWHTLLTSDYLSGLTALEISLDFESGQTNPASVLSSLAACPSLSTLTSLRFEYLHLENTSSQAAFQALAMPALNSLSLTSTRADALSVISSGTLLKRLNTLDLSGNRLRRHPLLRQFGESASRLQDLRLNRCGLSDGDVHLLFNDPHFPSLASLEVEFNDLTDRSLARMLTALPHLKRLSLNHVRFEGQALRQLSEADQVAPLEEFSIHAGTDLAASDISAVADIMPSRLSLSLCGLTDDAVAPLFQAANIRHLRSLDLSTNRLTDMTAEQIVQSSHLDQLRFLSMKENAISGDMKKALRSKYGPGVCTFSQ